MNTARSVWVGWVSLGIAGGGAYYFAKRSINADKAERAQWANRRRHVADSLESKASSTIKNGRKRSDHAGSPSSEATNDPAPTRHEPSSDKERVREKSKYEAATPYRSRKGDRFS